jgi:penicillin-binding protein 2
MFERRLKIFLIVLSVCSMALALRAAQIQWLQHNYWQQQSTQLMSQSQLIDTTRGSILDRNGRVLAHDTPCIDASVDYPAITEEPDPDWVADHAVSALRNRLGPDAFTVAKASKQWPQLLHEQSLKIRADVTAMWAELGRISGQTPDQVEDIRRAIVAKVQTQKRYLWWWNYKNADAQSKKEALPWYRKMWGGQVDIDNFDVNVGEEDAPHVILPAIDTATQVELSRQLERFPALSLEPSKHREYPFGRTACHILGHLSRVGPQDMGANDPFGGDRLRKYHAQDLLGRSGIEALCEKTLRGYRGWSDESGNIDDPASGADPVPGKDVKLSIDIELESDIEQAFVKSRVQHTGDNASEIRADQHGAAVVEDIETGQVLAMVSNPGFDLNTLDTHYAALAHDDLNLPLFNRATQMAVEPGSTIKVVVGSGSITEGIMSPTSTIQCRGVLVIDGREQPHGHCWVYEYFKHGQTSAPTHNAAARDNALPNDMLTVADGLERSCNVVFETIADRMGMTNLCHWYSAFGLGKISGVGIEEVPGRLFRPGADDPKIVRMLTWSAGIGEGVVQATPIQMADVAATIARRGIWIRPHLVDASDAGRATTRPAEDLGPDRVDLHLSPEAVSVAQRGMFEVCNGDHGTGWGILPEKQEPVMANDPLSQIEIAGKTGTAQTSPLSRPRRDSAGNILRDEQGRVEFDRVPIGAPGTENWYKSADNRYQHAWFIGYAPAKHPKIAFCVLVEYGEAGGRVAGAIAHDVLEACVRHGYLSPAQANPISVSQADFR